MIRSLPIIAALFVAAVLMAANSKTQETGCLQPVITEIATAPLRPRGDGPVTIASLNMAEKTDYRQVLEEFHRSKVLADADVVLLQEVVYSDSPEGVLQGLSRELGVHAVFSSATPPRPDRRLDGIAMLSRYPIQKVDAFSLTSFNLNVRSRCRHALAATLAAPNGESLQAFIREAQQPVTGEVRLNLYKGNLMVDGRSSPNSLYDEGIATMEGGGSYNQTDAEGFLRIQGLPSRVQGRIRPRAY